MDEPPSVIILSSPSSSMSATFLCVSRPFMPITSTGHAYLPDGLCDTPQPQTQTPYPMWLTLLIFLGLFAVL